MSYWHIFKLNTMINVESVNEEVKHTLICREVFCTFLSLQYSCRLPVKDHRSWGGNAVNSFSCDDRQCVKSGGLFRVTDGKSKWETSVVHFGAFILQFRIIKSECVQSNVNLRKMSSPYIRVESGTSPHIMNVSEVRSLIVIRGESLHPSSRRVTFTILGWRDG